MKKKSLFIFIVFALVIIAIILGFIIFLNNNENIKNFNYKISLLENSFNENPNIKSFENSKDEQLVILSICNNDTKAIVRSKQDSSFKIAYKNLIKEMSKYIRKNNYSANYIKIDFANNFDEKSVQDFENELSYLEQEYLFYDGVIFHYQNREDIVLTGEELNSNNIIDYENNNFNLKNLNAYLSYCNKSPVTSLPATFKTFSTISYFCDDNNQIYEIDSTGKRIVENLSLEEINKILKNSSSYLANMIKLNGEFVYGYYPLKNREIENYNILRHAGSVWSLILSYDYGNVDKSKIDSALDYLVGTVKYSNDEISYIQELKSNEIKLGGNALSVIALCEYIDKFNDSKFINLAETLGNGILSMQKDDGGYNHVLNSNDFSLKNDYRTVYYDGEATFALCKLYGITKNVKYLKAAEKSINYFIKNDYTRIWRPLDILCNKRNNKIY